MIKIRPPEQFPAPAAGWGRAAGIHWPATRRPRMEGPPRPPEPRRSSRNLACPRHVSKAPNAPLPATNASLFAASAYSNATNAYSFATSAYSNGASTYSNAPTKHAEAANEYAEVATKHAEVATKHAETATKHADVANEYADAVSETRKTQEKPLFAPVKTELGRFRGGGRSAAVPAAVGGLGWWNPSRSGHLAHGGSLVASAGFRLHRSGCVRAERRLSPDQAGSCWVRQCSEPKPSTRSTAWMPTTGRSRNSSPRMPKATRSFTSLNVGTMTQALQM